jgi:beta-phosphoglucomutase-like phosphatase (HAD superfamily)
MTVEDSAAGTAEGIIAALLVVGWILSHARPAYRRDQRLRFQLHVTPHRHERPP